MSKKQLLTHLRFIYRVGLLKTLLILFAFFTADAEYKVRWKNRDVYLRKGTTDFTVFRQVLVFEQYAMRSRHYIHTIVDLGANIGLATVYFKTKFPDARIVSVEPEKRNFAMLQKNVSGLPDVHCIRKAIWNSRKLLQVKATEYGEYAFSITEMTDNRGPKVESITMDDIMSEYHIPEIGLLKIDIEGSEKELFSSDYESWLTNVDCIVIELHDCIKPGCAESFFRAVSSRSFNMSGRGENITIAFT